ncbi:MAG: hypothetical protein F6K00_24495 [Leptolyngbya sp. SIOISBB]|nr:hypothetical protein [Leptolyngbya sp. SIOISBB]
MKETSDLDDVETVGNPDTFKLLFKAQGISQGSFFKKSTKAMRVPGGCIIQVTNERQNPDGSWNVAEALTFIPGDLVVEKDINNGHLVSISENVFLDNKNDT